MRGSAKTRTVLAIAVALLAATGAAGCSSGRDADTAGRATEAVDACREHGGVTAFDDDAVICGDQTARDDRGRRAVEACRGNGGVSAFDDDIVICADESFHRVDEGA